MGRNHFFLGTSKRSTRPEVNCKILDVSDSYLYRSYPADNGEPRVGNFALEDRRLMRRLVTGARAGDIFRFLSWGEADMQVGR